MTRSISNSKILKVDALRRIASGMEVHATLRRASLAIQASEFPDEEAIKRYESEWGRPLNLDQEIDEVERALEYTRGSKYEGDIRLTLHKLKRMKMRQNRERTEQEENRQVNADLRRTANAHFDDVHVYHVTSPVNIPSSFTKIANGFYKKGHAIWELRAAEDEEGGYVLARKQEEMASDLKHAKVASSAETLPFHRLASTLCNSCVDVVPRIGARMAFIITEPEVQSLPVVVMDVNEDEGLADVETDEGSQISAPFELLVPESGCDGSCHCPCHAVEDEDMQDIEDDMEEVDFDDAMQDAVGEDIDFDIVEAPEEIQLEASDFDRIATRVFLARARITDPAEAWGKWIKPTKAFRPLYSPSVEIDPNQTYMLEGSSRPDPERDRLYGVENPVMPYPDATSGTWKALNDRVRLVPYGSDQTVFVSPTEVEEYFSMAQKPGGNPDMAKAFNDVWGGTGTEDTKDLGLRPTTSRPESYSKEDLQNMDRDELLSRMLPGTRITPSRPQNPAVTKQLDAPNLGGSKRTPKPRSGTPWPIAE